MVGLHRQIRPAALLIGVVLMTSLLGCAQPGQPIAKGYVIDPCGKPGQYRRVTRAEAKRAERARPRGGMTVHCAPRGPTNVMVEDMIPIL